MWMARDARQFRLFVLCSILTTLGGCMSAPTSMQVAELEVARYSPEIERCTRSFFAKRPPSPDVSVTVANERGLLIIIELNGRSPAMAIPTAGYRERHRITVQISRDFENPSRVVAHVFETDSMQTPWPDSDETALPISKFKNFSPAEMSVVGTFVREYSTHLGKCVGSDADVATL